MALGTVMAVVFTACGGDDDESAARDASAETEAPADIGDESLTGADSAATAPDTTDSAANSGARVRSATPISPAPTSRTWVVTSRSRCT